MVCNGSFQIATVMLFAIPLGIAAAKTFHYRPVNARACFFTTSTLVRGTWGRTRTLISRSCTFPTRAKRFSCVFSIRTPMKGRRSREILTSEFRNCFSCNAGRARRLFIRKDAAARRARGSIGDSSRAARLSAAVRLDAGIGSDPAVLSGCTTMRLTE